MRPSSSSSSSSASSFFFYSSHYDTQNGNPAPPTTTTTIPIDSPPEPPTPIPVRLAHAERAAAVKIQAAYRSHLTRALVCRIAAADREAGRFEALIRTQETVDAVRRDERERLRLSEGLMALLLGLDAVPGLYPAVRELRRAVSRRIVGLQEVLDAVVGARVEEEVDGFPRSWEDVVYAIEEVGGVGAGAVVEDEGNGFRCLESLLRFDY